MRFVQNQGDAWHYTLDSLSQFFEAALARKKSEHCGSGSGAVILSSLRKAEIPPHVHELIGTYLDSAQLLGRRTAELHLALSSDYADPQFAPEPFTDHYRQAIYHSMMGLTAQTFQLLRQRLSNLARRRPKRTRRKLLGRQEQIRARFRLIPERRIAATRIRLHDDLRLEQSPAHRQGFRVHRF